MRNRNIRNSPVDQYMAFWGGFTDYLASHRVSSLLLPSVPLSLGAVRPKPVKSICLLLNTSRRCKKD